MSPVSSGLFRQALAEPGTVVSCIEVAVDGLSVADCDRVFAWVELNRASLSDDGGGNGGAARSSMRLTLLRACNRRARSAPPGPSSTRW